jgi:5-methylcytosine-specific restriction endonuclease McrA
MPNLPKRAKALSRPDTRDFHASNEWVKARNAHRAEYPICQRCTFLGTVTRVSSQELSVHHIIPLELDMDKRTDADNLLTVCVPCHWNYTQLERTGRTQQSIAEGQEVRDHTQHNRGFSF